MRLFKKKNPSNLNRIGAWAVAAFAVYWLMRRRRRRIQALEKTRRSGSDAAGAREGLVEAPSGLSGVPTEGT